MKLPHTIGKELLCSMEDNNAKLLGLEEVIVKNVWGNEKEQHIDIELPRRVHTCPCCGTETERIHDYRMQCIKDRVIGDGSR